jgi:hypothetical protein
VWNCWRLWSLRNLQTPALFSVLTYVHFLWGPEGSADPAGILKARAHYLLRVDLMNI